MFPKNSANLSRCAILKRQTTFHVIWHQCCSLQSGRVEKILNEICSQVKVKRRQKAGFLSLISSEITLVKEKERRKRKSEEKERRRRQKSDGCALSFYNGYFGDNVFKNPARYVPVF